jgi:hypothetical protein
MSQGTVDNILKDMSDKSLRAYDEIRNRVEQSRVVGADETGVKINGKLYSNFFSNPMFRTITMHPKGLSENKYLFKG